MNKRYTTEELIEAVKTSYSIRQVLQQLNIIPAGGNYQTIKTRIKNLGIDTSHFTGKLWSKGKKLQSKRQIEFYLQKDCAKIINSHTLRLRLINEGLKQSICEICNLSEWNGKPIPLELHHCDGNNKNNELSNLQILCPNCHAQTETYRGKNQRK